LKVFVSVATIANISTGNVPMFYVLIIGIAKLISGAISMGIGDYLSSKAEVDLIQLERKREMWECENFLKGEKDEMADIDVEKGLHPESATMMVDLMSSNKKAFVDVMMVQELGLKSDVDVWGPLKSGFCNFFSFIFFGSIPLIIYVITSIIDAGGKSHGLDQHGIFYIDIGITTLTLIFMGFVKSRYSSQNWIVSVVFTLIIGFIAAGSGYLLAFALVKILHINQVG
jgi:VIT1/CCC1 family predicted Fe2+/Mn2+ transporter